jgi:tyrosinase
MTLRATIHLLPALLSLISLVAGQSYDYGFDVGKVTKRQAQTPFVLRGLGRVNGSFPVRQEIRQLQQNQEQWTLYLLGLSMLQYTDQSEQLSYYQIAGASHFALRSNPDRS